MKNAVDIDDEITVDTRIYCSNCSEVSIYWKLSGNTSLNGLVIVCCKKYRPFLSLLLRGIQRRSRETLALRIKVNTVSYSKMPF